MLLMPANRDLGSSHTVVSHHIVRKKTEEARAAHIAAQTA
jgi:hypothetical protein